MSKSLSYPSMIYLLGAGGIGMSALGHYFLDRGCRVAGYDKVPGLTTRMLEAKGADLMYQDAPSLVPPAFADATSDLWVVYTPAVPADLKLFSFFRKNGCPVLKRAEVLGRIASAYTTLAVAGTHGKTTTTAAVAHILRQSGKDATAFIGGISKNANTNFIAGKDEWLVAEADEYDRSFHFLKPAFAAITSVEPDHLDIYGDYDRVKDAFRTFASGVTEKVLIHEKYKTILDQKKDMLTYGSDPLSDYSCRTVKCGEHGISFDFHFPEISLPVRIPVYGVHNAENAVAAGALAHLSGISPQSVCHALSTYTGVRRRFDVVWSDGVKMLIDDYAHHPDEMDALAKTLKTHFPDKKSLAVFQPHLFSRTRDFADRFAQSLSQFHSVVLLDIYPAREQPIPGIDSQMLLGKIPVNQKYFVQSEELRGLIKQLDFDILVTIGAGDIDQHIPSLIQCIKETYEGKH